MPDGNVTLAWQEYRSLLDSKADLEREIARLQTVNTLEVARVVDPNLSKAIGHAVAITKFAMSRLPPEVEHGWPANDLGAFAQLLANRPHESQWAAVDEESWVADARDFALECIVWDQKRGRQGLKPMAPGSCAYLAHPIGRGPEREDNLRRAQRWVKYLVDTYDHAICAPWLPYCQVLDEEAHRPRGLRDGLAMLRRCDILYAVGGRISEGMRAEMDLMATLGRPIIDLTALGPEPPASTSPGTP